MLKDVEADTPAGLAGLSIPIELIERGADCGEGTVERLQQFFAGGRKGDAPTGSVDQAHAEASLHSLERVAEGRGADAKLQAGAPEAAVARYRQKGAEIGKVGPIGRHAGFGPSPIR